MTKKDDAEAVYRFICKIHKTIPIPLGVLKRNTPETVKRRRNKKGGAK